VEHEALTIISGGQTGADRAALDWAIENRVPHGGWCPLGRRAEDGVIAGQYNLKETPTDRYVQRTEWNVRDSDATVIVSLRPLLAGGSQKTLEFARKQKKPCLVLCRAGSATEAATRLERFVQENQVRVLHVAGPRASEEPGIGDFVKTVLDSWHEVLAASPVATPILTTARLKLRPFTPGDAPLLAARAGAREIVDTTIAIPHPYSESQARDWISRIAVSAAKGTEFAFAVTCHEELIGAVGLRDTNREHGVAELGAWIAIDYWGKGYATEAARAVVRFGFEQLSLNRICAHHMVRNPASGRMLTKIGMKHEGCLRQRVRKWGLFEDVIVLSILREDWLKLQEGEAT
jgi:ribosomal-protein-alanine N-acetyltransferase